MGVDDEKRWMSFEDTSAFEEDPTNSYTADSDFLQALCHFFSRHSRPGRGQGGRRTGVIGFALSLLHDETTRKPTEAG